MKSSNLILSRLTAMPTPYGVAASSAREPDALTTSQYLLLLNEFEQLRKSVPHVQNQLVRSLLSRQGPDGRWERDGDNWHTSITAWAVLALKACGEGASNAVSRATEWLRARQTTDGAFFVTAGSNEIHTYPTAYAAAALARPKGEAQTDATDRALSWLVEAQSDAGGFGDERSSNGPTEPSLTAYVCHALETVADRRVDQVVERSRQYIQATQRSSGAWTAWFEDADSVEGTIAALRVLAGAGDLYSDTMSRGFDYLGSAFDPLTEENWVVISSGFLTARMVSQTEVRD